MLLLATSSHIMMPTIICPVAMIMMRRNNNPKCGDFFITKKRNVDLKGDNTDSNVDSESDTDSVQSSDLSDDETLVF